MGGVCSNNCNALHKTNMISVNRSISPRFINGRLSSPSVDTCRPFRDLYGFKSSTSMSESL